MKKSIIKAALLLAVANSFVGCNEDDSSIITGQPDAVINTDSPDAPPRGWTESWLGHEAELNRMYYDDYVAVYYDADVDRSVTWTYEFMSDVWKYTTENYGSFGSENRLYAVFHGEFTGVARTGNIFDEATSYRSLTDVPLDGLEMSGWNIDAPVHEVAHVVEGSSHGVHESPAFEIWGDSKWAEIFQYDVYMGIGMESEATRLYDQYMETTADFPRADTYWFRDWFYPIYDTYNKSATFNNFFSLLAEYFPIDGDTYARRMNMGEFVHFFSGATGDDLQPLAEAAFGWTDEWNEELEQARIDFPLLDYPFESTITLTDWTYEATLSVSADHPDGPNAGEGSNKLIDDNVNSKLYLGAYTSDWWAQQTFTEARKVNKYKITSGNDAPDRDPKNWTLSGSNDGTTWEVLDTKTDVTFSNRNQTIEYSFENETPYLHYRLNITALLGGGAMQFSEWRLLYLGPPED